MDLPPRDAQQAQAGELLRLEAGGAVVGHGAVVWASASPKSLSLEGKQLLREDSEACAVPILPHGWFAVDTALEFTPFTTVVPAGKFASAAGTAGSVAPE